MDCLDKVKLLARLRDVSVEPLLPPARALLKGVWRLGEFGLDLKGVMDYVAERERLQKEMDRIKAEIDRLLKKLNSHEFIARAPESVVAESRARHTELVERLERIEANMMQIPPG
jgi:valyl-tRNA synthetase